MTTAEARRQTPMEKYNFTSTSSRTLSNEALKKLQDATVRWIVADCRPLTMTEDEGFRSMMKLATGCETYVPPCYSTITAQMHHMYELQRSILVDRLTNAASVSLTADFWTSSQNRNYIGVTAHFIENWTLQSVVLDILEVNESHTAEVCGQTLVDIAKDWSISDKVLCIITDRGRNIVKSVVEHTPYINSNCMAHIFQRAIAAGFKASSMDTLLTKCRKLVGHFKHSPKQTSLLSKAAEELQLRHLSLIQNVTTRWFSCLAMAQRLLSQKEAVNKVLDEAGDSKFKLNDADFARLEQLVKLLAPLKEISDFLGGEKYVTGSCTVHILRKLEAFLIPTADDTGYLQQFKEAFSSYLEHQIRTPPILKACAFVDPRFKNLKGLPDKDKEHVHETILNGMASSMTSQNDETATDDHVVSQDNVAPSFLMDSDTDNENFDNGENNTAMLQAELLSYRSTKVEPLSTDPLAFWRSHAGTFPHVAQQAEKLLCVTATSLPYERLFSVAGILVEKKRTSLTPEHVREILSLNSWLK